MTTIHRLGCASLLALALVACGDDSSSPPDASTPTPDAPTTPDAGPPGKPALGAQIDRFGRPAINTALIAPFQGDAAMRGMKRDSYNHDATASGWGGAWTAEIKTNLAILDGLDTVCGNQLVADATAQRYAALAGALADDEQYLKSDATTCTAYLAVEANALGVLANSDCGGRTLDYDVIDESYSVLAAGALSGVGDGIAKTATTSSTFPYLGAPQ
jgi:hypothetical protein